MYSFDEMNFDEFENKNLEKYNGDIYNSIYWLKVLKEADDVKPIILKIKFNNNVIGYFTGGLFKKFGINIIGSPFKGWTTPYMGFSVEDNYPIEDIVPSLWNFLRKKYKCLYAEICDKKFDEQKLKQNKLKYISNTTYAIDMNKSIDEIFSSFSSHRRQHIKHFEKYGGGVLKMIELDEKFISDFYKMTEDVFSLQGLKPSYNQKKVDKIVELIPSQYIHCAKAYNPEKKCIGMSMVFGYGKNCQTFMVVTDHEEKYDQNAALFWDAIKYWHERGITWCDLLGKRPYKEGFRPDELVFHRVILTRFKMLFLFRNIVKKLYWTFNHMNYKFSKRNT